VPVIPVAGLQVAACNQPARSYSKLKVEWMAHEPIPNLEPRQQPSASRGLLRLSQFLSPIVHGLNISIVLENSELSPPPSGGKPL
jgi:hypothetical protein